MRILIYIYTLFFALVTVSGEVGINKNGRMYNTIGSNKLKFDKGPVHSSEGWGIFII